MDPVEVEIRKNMFTQNYIDNRDNIKNNNIFLEQLKINQQCKTYYWGVDPVDPTSQNKFVYKLNCQQKTNNGIIDQPLPMIATTPNTKIIYNYSDSRKILYDKNNNPVKMAKLNNFCVYDPNFTFCVKNPHLNLPSNYVNMANDDREKYIVSQLQNKGKPSLDVIMAGRHCIQPTLSNTQIHCFPNKIDVISNN